MVSVSSVVSVVSKVSEGSDGSAGAGVSWLPQAFRISRIANTSAAHFIFFIYSPSSYE